MTAIRRLHLAALAAASVLTASCGDPAQTTAPAAATPPPGTERYKVVATVGMIGDLVERVAGDRAEVQVLMGPGVDPHLYKATRSDLARLNDAQVVFYNGLLLEGKMTDTLVRLAQGGKTVRAVTEGLPDAQLLGEEGAAATEESANDPHVWMDPRLWSRTLEVIERTLASHDPAGREGYAARAAEARRELEELDAYAERVLATVPEPARVLITAHDAFHYFGRRYGYRVEGIQGLSTESEAGVRDIQRLVDLIAEREIGAVFVETSVTDRNVRALVDGARARGRTVAIGGSLFSDAMGAAGTYEGTYPGMIDHNVTTIARALGGDAPERGLRGRLTVR